MKNLGDTFVKVCVVTCLFCCSLASVSAQQPTQTQDQQPSVKSLAEGLDYERARWHPLHFKPNIDNATNEQCLSCHQEVLEKSVKEQSPAGVKAADSLAWYQTLEVYTGEQETFHRRHLVTPLAKRVMDLKCNFCHQGNDPREEAPPTPSDNDVGFTLRKMVSSEQTCLKCHGRHNYEVMGLPGAWEQSRDMMGGSCTTACHSAIRTNRHQVTYLNAEEIEKAAQENADTCYGCHGGRQWYRTTYPYPRHAWQGMPEAVPDWAKDRPTESDSQYRIQAASTPTAAPAAATPGK